jgi:hypothetical protein
MEKTKILLNIPDLNYIPNTYPSCAFYSVIEFGYSKRQSRFRLPLWKSRLKIVTKEEVFYFGIYKLCRHLLGKSFLFFRHFPPGTGWYIFRAPKIGISTSYLPVKKGPKYE